MISLWKLREKKNVAQMPFVKNTPEMQSKNFTVILHCKIKDHRFFSRLM